METLEQYGIKDVTPRNSAGCSETLRGVVMGNGGAMYLYVGKQFVGYLADAKDNHYTIGRESMYVSGGSSVWVSEVRHN